MAMDKILVGPPADSDPAQLHLVNCKLDQDGSSMAVAQYFDSQQTNFVSNSNGASNLKVSFRGRPLNGRRVQLPDQFTFAEVSKSENENQLVASELTQGATYWNLDKHPSNTDPVPQAVQWLKLCNDIHAHVQLDD